MDGNSSKQAFLLEFLDSCGDNGNMLTLWDTDVETSFFLFDLLSLCSVISSMTSDSSKKFVFRILILVSMIKNLEGLTMVETSMVLVKMLRSPLFHVGGVFLLKTFLLNGP